MVTKYMLLALTLVTVLFASYSWVKGEEAAGKNLKMEGLIEALRVYDRKVKEYQEAPESRQMSSCRQLHQSCTGRAGRSYTDPNSQHARSQTGRNLFANLISIVFGSNKEDDKPAMTTPAPGSAQQCCGNGITLDCNGSFCVPCIRNITKIGGYYYGETCF